MSSSLGAARLGMALSLALCACATLPLEIAVSSECRADYLGLDRKVADAGAGNAGAHRIEGFPYLRSDRFLASFRTEVPDGPRFDTWVERLRALDLLSRASELKNTGWQDPRGELDRLDRCGKAWAARDLADPARRAKLREAAAVPDDYSLLKRALGLYPLVVPFLDFGMSTFNQGVREEYARPVEQLDAPGTLTLWTPSPHARGEGRGEGQAARWLSQRDELGVPKLDAAQWRALAAAHLPNWQIETTGDFDKPGTVTLKGGQPDFDATQPVTYFAPAYTRFGARVLAQLIYVVWFSQRPPTGLINAYGGALDGIVWRVTLDESGAPLLYDTIHACGCYHYYFTAQNLKRKPQGGFLDEPILFPQSPAPAEPFAVRIQSGTHYVRRLVPLAALRGDEASGGIVGAPHRRDYVLRDYSELLALDDGAGATRSLFEESGLVRGTDRRERLWLWPAGIQSAGAMRQLGRHATSFVGRTHFDDPAMLDRLFEP